MLVTLTQILPMNAEVATISVAVEEPRVEQIGVVNCNDQ